MSISPVGSGWSNGGTGISTLSVSPTAVGDVLAFAVNSENDASPATGVSGGGVTTWHRGTSYEDTDVNAYLDVWWGVVASTGSSVITVTGLPGGSEFTVLWAQQFNESNAGWVWSLVAASPAGGSSGHSTGSGTNVSWPSLTASGATDYCYVGNGLSVFGNLSAGSTPGYTYPFTGFSSNRPVYNQTFSGTGNPTSTQTNTANYDTVAIVLGAAPSGGTSHTATASLTVTPSFSAGRTRGKYRTGSLAVSPSLSAARTRGKYRSGLLTVVPVFVSSRTQGHVRHGSLVVPVSFRAVPSGGAAPAVQQGSWWGLVSVLRHSRQEFDSYISRPPMACPNCGEPLTNAPTTASASGVQLFCKFDGWQYPRDWHPPTRPVTGAGAW